MDSNVQVGGYAPTRSSMLDQAESVGPRPASPEEASLERSRRLTLSTNGSTDSGSRTLGLFSTISLYIGLVVGSGVFSSPGPLYKEIGSFYGTSIIWIISGLLSFVGALCYAELGAAYPKSGGEHIYLHMAFGRIPSFLFSFTGWLTRPASISILSSTLADYVLSTVNARSTGDSKFESTRWQNVWVAVVFNILITSYSAISKNSSVWVQNVLGVIKISALLAFGFTGIYFIFGVNGVKFADQYLDYKGRKPPDAFKSLNFGLIAKGFYLALWGYDGWSNLNLVAGDIKNPRTNLPWSLIIGTFIVGGIYFLMNMAYFAVLTSDRFTQVDAISDFGYFAYKGNIGRIISLCAVSISTFGALGSTIFCNAEVAVIASKEGYAPNILSYVSPRFGTPVVSLAVQCLISIIISIAAGKNYDSMVIVYSVPFWIFYASAAAALIHLRKKDPNVRRPIKVPLFVPIMFIAWTVFMLASTVTGAIYEFALSIGIFVLGIIIWYAFLNKKFKGC